MLRIRRPTVNDAIIAEKLAEGDQNKLNIVRMANVCEVPYEAFGTLDEQEDVETLFEAYGLLRSYDGKAEGNPMVKMADNRRNAEITLHYPIKWGEGASGEPGLVDKLIMRRPRLSDSTEAESKSDWATESSMHKFAALCGVDIEVIKQLDDIDDFRSVEHAYNSFRRPRLNRRK